MMNQSPSQASREVTLAELMPFFEALSEESEALREGYASLEAELALARDDVGWDPLTGMGADQFSKSGINGISDLARKMYQKNPLINRSIEVKKDYVFAQGVTISAEWDDLNTVIQAFLDDPKNRVELTSPQALCQKEIERQTDGNIFFVLFTNRKTGRVRIRSIPLPEITEVVTDPEDAKTVWYYKRQWTAKAVDGATETKTAYYPDWRYSPPQEAPTLNGHKVRWDAPVYHLKTGGFSDWTYGVSDVYSALAWARACTKFLENWATIVQALARFAFKATTKAGSKGVAAIKSKLNTTLGVGTSEANPPPVAGSTAVMADGVDFQPLKTAGATTSMEEGRRLFLMVAAAVGLPETFYGDAKAGSLATARSLDRPTELMMKAIQALWTSVLRDILGYVALWAAYASAGKLQGKAAIARDEDDESLLVLTWNTDINATIDVTFPPIVEIDPGATITAITAAAPRIPEPKLIARLLLSALNVPDIDEVLEAIDWDAIAKQQEEARQMAMQGQRDANQQKDE